MVNTKYDRLLIIYFLLLLFFVLPGPAEESSAGDRVVHLSGFSNNARDLEIPSYGEVVFSINAVQYEIDIVVE